MQRCAFVVLFLLCGVGSASAYSLNLDCQNPVQAGLLLNCSVGSNLPAGTVFDVVFYQSVYTSTPFSKIPLTVQGDHPTINLSFDTRGLPEGQYKVEAQFSGPEGGKLSSDSATLRVVRIIDRSGDITITSPMSQTLNDALRIEGSMINLGAKGIEIEVRGEDDSIFGPQYIDTKPDRRTGAGIFTRKIPVPRPGRYDVYFWDEDGYHGIKTFTVLGESQVTGSVPVTSPTSTQTTASITPPTTPRPSPLPVFSVVAALFVIGLLMITVRNRR